MDNPELARWLRQQRQQRGWSQSRMAREIISAALADGDHEICGDGSMIHNVYRWERHGDGPKDRYRPHVARALGIHPHQFGPGPHEPLPPESPATPAAQAIVLAIPPGSPAALTGTVIPATPGSPGAPHLQVLDNFAYGGMQTPEMGASHVRREVLMAAHESSDHAQMAEQHGIGETTFEQLRADVIRLSRLACTDDPFPIFQEERRVRDRILRLLERRLWPREQSDLYFLVGCLSLLMGTAADDLGYPDAAEELLRAGCAYATAIDHRPLLGTLRLGQARVAFWRGLLHESRDLAESGLSYLPAGPMAANLHFEHARAAASVGDMSAARRAVADGHEARDRGDRYELLTFGGEFSISRATHHYCAGAALAAIDVAEEEAAAEVEQAADLYHAGPEQDEQHGFGCHALARIELARIRLRSGALDAAAGALEHVLALPPSQRISQVGARLRDVRSELHAPLFRESPQAKALDEQIEEFMRDSVSAGLHSLSGRPA